jgi:hypothetical protein
VKQVSVQALQPVVAEIESIQTGHLTEGSWNYFRYLVIIQVNFAQRAEVDANKCIEADCLDCQSGQND